MAKLTPKLPLLPDKTQPGFEHIVEIKELIKQNMKMVILTNPGERVMNPSFGVGIRKLLFENLADSEIVSFYQAEVRSQVQEHLPYVDLQEVSFDDGQIDLNKINIRISYNIPSLEDEDELVLALTAGGR